MSRSNPLCHRRFPAQIISRSALSETAKCSISQCSLAVTHTLRGVLSQAAARSAEYAASHHYRQTWQLCRRESGVLPHVLHIRHKRANNRAVLNGPPLNPVEISQIGRRSDLPGGGVGRRYEHEAMRLSPPQRAAK